VGLSSFKSNVVNASVLGETGGNPNLQNEVANSWTAGVVLRPHWTPRLQVAIDWINIDLENAITALTLTQVMDACYDAPASSFPNNQFCGLFTRNGQGQVTTFSTPLENIQGQTFNGLQVQANYSIDVDDIPYIHSVPFMQGDADRGNLSFFFGGFYTHRLDNLILGVNTPLAGDVGYPVWKMNGSVRWRRGPWMVYLESQYISPASADVTQAPTAQQIEHTGAYWQWNTAVSYDVTKNITAMISINDLFNQGPPANAYLLNNQMALSTYNYLGQQFVFTLRAKF
jgi:iron complex outermembrane receptor protein